MGKKKPSIGSRKPPDKAQRARFLAAGAAPEVAASGRVFRRQDGRDLVKLHVYVPADLAAELCGKTGRDKSHVIAEGIRHVLTAQAKSAA